MWKWQRKGLYNKSKTGSASDYTMPIKVVMRWESEGDYTMRVGVTVIIQGKWRCLYDEGESDCMTKLKSEREGDYTMKVRNETDYTMKVEVIIQWKWKWFYGESESERKGDCTMRV